MNKDKFLSNLQKSLCSFEKSISCTDNTWIIKGLIDVHKNVYPVSLDTKMVSKAMEILIFPLLQDFAGKNSLEMELSREQNFYPDIAFICPKTKEMFAVDIKTTYRINNTKANGMTLGAFTGYFRNRESTKNISYPYSRFSSHIVLGIIYSQNGHLPEKNVYSLEELKKIPSVIKDFKFFAQPKYKIASSRPGSGNTKNIGSITGIDELLNGKGPFANLGEEVFDDYWMNYLTNDMARAWETPRPYSNLKEYFEYKSKNIEILAKNKDKLSEEDTL